MSYSITNSNGTLLVTIPDGVLDNTTTDLTLMGNNAPNFGQGVNQNFVNLLQHWANDTAPPLPTVGQLWYDTSSTVLKIYEGTVWTIASQNINLSASNVPFELASYSGNPGLVATICNDVIVAITSAISIANANLPPYITINNKPYLFQSLFSKGLFPGITLADASSNIIGYTTKANSLITPANIILTGAATGYVGIDGTSNVNLKVGFSNVYVGNTTVAGNWSKVTVSDAGQVVGVDSVAYDDIVNALGYVPFNSANVTPNWVGNTVISRDINGSFVANIMIGTATGTESFTSNSAIYFTGSTTGETALVNYSGNVILNSNLAINSNVEPGIYNTLAVGGNGIVQSAFLIDNMPIGSIVLFNQPTIPVGWAACNGQEVTLPSGYVVQMPSMSNAIVGFVNAAPYYGSIYADVCGVPVTAAPPHLDSSGFPIPGGMSSGGTNNIYVANSDTSIEVVWSAQIGAIYIMHIFEDTNIPAGEPGIGILSTNLSGNVQQIELIGGANIIYPPLVYNSNIISQTPVSEHIVYNFVEAQEFGNNTFYDAAALLLSAGDVNAVMMSAVDIYGDLSDLVVQQVLYNLQNRHMQGLPPRLGKYMLSQADIINYMGVLELPIDTTFFTVALQDEIMLLKVADITNKYVAANLYPDPSKLFGAVYIGYPQYLAVMQAAGTSTVGSALVSAGFDVTGDPYTDNLLCFEFIQAIQTMITTATNVIIQNQTSISVIEQLNYITEQPYNVPISLIQQPTNIVGNIYTGSNITVTTIDGIDNYYGGNINVNVTPGFGGGAFPYTSLSSSSAYYTILAQSRYLNATITITGNSTLKLSWNTGIGIDVGANTNTVIGDLATSKGTVNVVVGPVDAPQPTQEALQNSLIATTEQASIASQSFVERIVLPGSNQTTTQTTTQTITTTTATARTSATTVSNTVTTGTTTSPTTSTNSNPLQLHTIPLIVSS